MAPAAQLSGHFSLVRAQSNNRRAASHCGHAAQGCVESSKADLIAKGIIRKASSSPTAASVPAAVQRSSGAQPLQHLSRPGSAYIRVSVNPFRPSTGAQPTRDARGRTRGGYGELVSTPSSTGSSGAPISSHSQEAHSAGADVLAGERARPPLASTGSRSVSMGSIEL